MSTRTLHWWEAQYNNSKIAANNWQFQIAKAVATGSLPALSNVIWQSQGVAPETKIAWDVDYALNWTANVPSNGIRVSLSGRWQPCTKGQVLDIDDQGYFVPSSAPAKEEWMKVGTVNYKYPNVPGIHIVTGVKNADSGKYDPIFVDPTELPPGSSGVYQPQENIIWWLQGGTVHSQVYNGTRDSIGGQDFSNPAPQTNKYEWWTTYIFDDGNWANTQTGPDACLLAAPSSEPSSHEVELYPIVGLVSLTVAIVAAQHLGLHDYLTKTLSETFTDVKVEVGLANGKEIKISYGPRKSARSGSIEEIGILMGGEGPAAPIDEAVHSALAHHALPTRERWTINIAGSPSA